MQTSVFAQVATNMVNFSAGQAITGPAAAGSDGDLWNQVPGSWSGTTGTSGGCVDVEGNPVDDNLTISWGGGTFGGDASGPATALFAVCFLDFEGTSISVSVTGLATNANYVMYNYTIGDSGNTGGTITWVDGAGMTNIATADNTTYTPNSFVLNQNYTVLTGQSDSNGAINFTLSYPGQYPCWNGMQLMPAPPVPKISTQPQDTTNSIGSMAQFTVGATGTGLTYQWELTNGTMLTNNSRFTGCTSSILTINNVGAGDAGSYIVTVTGSGGGATNSQPATLTISLDPLLMNVQVNINGNGNYSGAGMLGYSGDLWNQFTINYGVSSIGLLDSFGNLTPVTFTLANSSGSGNDSSGDDGNGASPLLTSYYYSVANRLMTITLSGLNTNAAYTVIAYNAGNAYGQGATLGGALTGTAPAQETFSTLNLGGDCLGNTNVITDNSGNVTFSVSPPFGQPVGAFNGLQIELQPSLSSSALPVVSLVQVQPQSVIGIPPGNTAQFSVRAIGPGPLSYQWKVSKNGGAYADVNDPNVTGTTTNNLNFGNLQVSESGLYEAVVTGANGSTTSSPAQLTVAPVSQEVYHWQAPVSIDNLTCEQILDGVPGAYYEAEQAAGNNDVVTTTNGNSYTFISDGSAVTFSDGNVNNVSSGVWFGTTGNGTFDGILSGFYPDGGMHLITINNLTNGAQYSVQLFAIDDETGDTNRQSSYQDPNNNYDVSPTFTMGADDYVIGTFTATNTSMTIQQNLLSAGLGNINAVVVRTLPSVPAFTGPPVLNGSKFVLTWASGTLLQATNIAGPWTPTGAVSPYTNDVTASPQMYFKLSNQ